MVGGIGDWFGNQWTSLFGDGQRVAAPNIPVQPGVTGSSELGGLLDPRGIRQQAAWQGLGALSAGLLAAGQRRPASSPSPLPQALGAFGPAYQGALQSGYQTAAAERQMLQQQEQEQAWQSALAAADPARRVLMQSMGRERWGQALLQQQQPYNLSPGDRRMQGNQVIAAAPERPTAPRIEGNPEIGYWSFAPDANGRMVATPIAVAGSPTPTGQPPPSIAPAAQPGGAPSGQSTTPGDTRLPVGIRNNNWVSMTVPGTGGRQLQQYETPEIGIAAASQNLDRLFPSGTVTPRQLVQTWAQGPNYDPARVAPGIRASVENYGTAVARAAGVSNPDQPINLRDPATRLRVMQAMGQFETGGLPQGADAVLARGVALAAQPGARFTPIMPRQAQAGGGAPAQPAAAPAQPGTAPAPAPAPAAPSIPSLIPDRSGAAAAPPALPQGGDEDLVLRRPPGALTSGPSPQQITTAREFSSHFIGIPEVRNTLRITTVLSAMEDAATRGTAASDLNLVYGLMTILDPSSVVREGESVMVRSTQSVPDRLRGAVEQALSGTTALSPEARQALMVEARGRVQTQVATYNALHGREATLVRSANLNPNVVLGPRMTMPQPPRAPAPPAPPAPPPPSSAATPDVAPGVFPPRPSGVSAPPVPPPPPVQTPGNRPQPQVPLAIPPASTLGMMSITQIAPYARRLSEMTDDQRRAVEQVVAREEARVRAEQGRQ